MWRWKTLQNHVRQIQIYTVARTTIYFLPAFVAEHGRLEQQQGATQDLAKELNEVRASPTLPTFHSGARSSLLIYFCRRFLVWRNVRVGCKKPLQKRQTWFRRLPPIQECEYFLFLRMAEGGTG